MGLASRGQRDMDDGPSAVTEAEMDARIRLQARDVYLRAGVTAVALTALALAIPGQG